MGQDRLNALVSLSVEADLVQSTVQFSTDIVNAFARTKVRNKRII